MSNLNVRSDGPMPVSAQRIAAAVGAVVGICTLLTMLGWAPWSIASTVAQTNGRVALLETWALKHEKEQDDYRNASRAWRTRIEDKIDALLEKK